MPFFPSAGLLGGIVNGRAGRWGCPGGGRLVRYPRQCLHTCGLLLAPRLTRSEQRFTSAWHAALASCTVSAVALSDCTGSRSTSGKANEALAV